jgi:hypothetical protein
MSLHEMPHLVVLLPGILGSVLTRNGKDVWNISAGAVTRALWSLGSSVKDLAILDDRSHVDDLGDGVMATRLLTDTHLIPGLWKIDGYTKIAETIKGYFNVVPGANYFEFAYDWRRDNRAAAHRLQLASREWLRNWRTSTKNDQAKLILIGHSMGGLVARYFIEVLGGWRDTKSLVTFGTPYRGSLNALDFISNGFTKKVGPLTVADLSDFLRSLTSVYQLLPIYPCYDPGDGQLSYINEVTIPNLDPGRVAAALEFHHEIENAVESNLGDEEYRRSRYETHPVVGTFQPTLQSARRTDNGVELFAHYKGEDLDGDGTVPRVSATPIELGDQHREVFAAEQHASLQNDNAVLTQLCGLISGFQLDLDIFRDLAGQRLGLQVEDAFYTGEPIVVRARPESPMQLTAAIVDVKTGQTVTEGLLHSDVEEWQRVELAPLPEGTYRVTVAGGNRVRSVTDLFVVFSN